MGLFLLLGLIYYLRYFSGDDEETLLDQKGDGSDWVWLVIGLLIMLIPIWKLNVMPAKMMTRSIEGYVALSNGDVAGGSALYKEAFSYQTPWDRDSYTNFVYLVSNNYTVLSQLNPELLAYTIEIAQKDVAYNPKDTINQSNLAKIFNIGAKYYRSDQAKAHEYSVQAITAIDQAIASSPGRITLYFLRSQIYMTDNQADKALADLQYALSLNQNYYDSHCHLGKLYLQLNNFNEAGPFLDYCLDQGGVNLFEPSMVKMAINYYIDQNNTEKILVLYEELVSYEPKEVDHWINLAKLYHVFGRLPEAAAAAEEAAKLDPALQAEVDQFIQGLQ
jgi:tetratricopeptide (TPR) repeat protein